MSGIRSIVKSIYKRNRELEELYLNEWGASEVKVKDLRIPIFGDVHFEQLLNGSKGKFGVEIKILFIPDEKKVILGKWYYKDSKQMFFKNNQSKGEGLTQTEKSLMENFIMDISGLGLL